MIFYDIISPYLVLILRVSVDCNAGMYPSLSRLIMKVKLVPLRLQLDVTPSQMLKMILEMESGEY